MSLICEMVTNVQEGLYLCDVNRMLMTRGITMSVNQLRGILTRLINEGKIEALLVAYKLTLYKGRKNMLRVRHTNGIAWCVAELLLMPEHASPKPLPEAVVEIEDETEDEI